MNKLLNPASIAALVTLSALAAGTAWMTIQTRLSLHHEGSSKNDAPAGQCDHQGELEGLRAKVAELESRHSIWEVSGVPPPARRLAPEAEERVEEEVVDLRKRAADLEAMYAAAVEDNEYLSKQAESLQWENDTLRDELRLLRAAVGDQYWVQFQATPFYQQLSEEEREIVHDLFQRTGEQLALWQVKELISFLPGYYRDWDDWNERFRVAQRNVGSNLSHPSIQQLLQEKSRLAQLRDEKLNAILGEQAAQRFLGNH